jgi:hypothetical protein
MSSLDKFRWFNSNNSLLQSIVQVYNIEDDIQLNKHQNNINRQQSYRRNNRAIAPHVYANTFLSRFSAQALKDLANQHPDIPYEHAREAVRVHDDFYLGQSVYETDALVVVDHYREPNQDQNDDVGYVLSPQYFDNDIIPPY